VFTFLLLFLGESLRDTEALWSSRLVSDTAAAAFALLTHTLTYLCTNILIFIFLGESLSDTEALRSPRLVNDTAAAASIRETTAAAKALLSSR
jgi:hypothetical protein